MNRVRVSIYLMSTLVVICAAMFLVIPKKVFASTGINQELSFEGKIVNGSGTNIPDGSYNMEFKIYSGGTSSGGGTLDWTEDWLVGGSPVTFSSGTYQVNLGSITPFGGSIDWNSYPLYLSLQIGNTSTCVPAGNFTANCGGDGEMTPYILLTSTPYAFNSNELGGLTAAQFGQLGANQTWTGNNIIGSTAAGAFIVQNAGGIADLSVNTSSGNVSLGTGGASGINGNLIFNSTSSSAYSVSINTSGSLAASYSLTLPTSAPTANQCLQAGSSTPSQLTFGSCGSYIQLQSTTPGTAQTGNFNISGTGIVASLLTGSIDTASPGILSIGSTNATSITLGANTSTGSNISLSVAGSTTLQDATNSTTALSVLNATGAAVLSVDTLNQRVGIGTGSPVAIRLQVEDSTYSSNLVIFNNGVTGAPPAYPNSYTPTLSVITSETTGSRPLFFGYNNGAGGFAAFQTSGACGSFSQMCIDLGSGATAQTALENVGTQLNIAGGADGNFTNVVFNNTGTVSVTNSLAVTGPVSFKNSANSVAAFLVKDASGANLLSVNTTAGQVYVGSGVAGDATGYLLVLDSKTTTGDPAEVDGAMYYNSSSGRFRCGESGAWVDCVSGLLTSNTAPSTAVNTCTNACAAFDTFESLPANYCQPGRVITVTAYGVYSSITSINISMGIYMGTNTTTSTADTLIGSASGAISTGSARTDQGFSVSFSIVCISVGAPGAVNGQGSFTLNRTNVGSASGGMYTNANSAPTTNAATDILLFPTFSASDPGNTATVEQFIVNG